MPCGTTAHRSDILSTLQNPSGMKLKAFRDLGLIDNDYQLASRVGLWYIKPLEWIALDKVK